MQSARHSRCTCLLNEQQAIRAEKHALKRRGVLQHEHFAMCVGVRVCVYACFSEWLAEYDQAGVTTTTTTTTMMMTTTTMENVTTRRQRRTTAH